jgi:hypothetical protein
MESITDVVLSVHTFLSATAQLCLRQRTYALLLPMAHQSHISAPKRLIDTIFQSNPVARLPFPFPALAWRRPETAKNGNNKPAKGRDQ